MVPAVDVGGVNEYVGPVLEASAEPVGAQAEDELDTYQLTVIVFPEPEVYVTEAVIGDAVWPTS